MHSGEKPKKQTKEMELLYKYVSNKQINRGDVFLYIDLQSTINYIFPVDNVEFDSMGSPVQRWIPLEQNQIKMVRIKGFGCIIHVITEM